MNRNADTPDARDVLTVEQVRAIDLPPYATANEIRFLKWSHESIRLQLATAQADLATVRERVAVLTRVVTESLVWIDGNRKLCKYDTLTELIDAIKNALTPT